MKKRIAHFRRIRCQICLHPELEKIEEEHYRARGVRPTWRRLKELGYRNENGNPFGLLTVQNHFKKHTLLRDSKIKVEKEPDKPSPYQQLIQKRYDEMMNEGKYGEEDIHPLVKGDKLYW